MVTRARKLVFEELEILENIQDDVDFMIPSDKIP